MERPIPMSSEMVRAILDGRKHMTRLPIEPSTSTVLGYNVTAKSKLWTWLVWDDRVFVDGGLAYPGSVVWQYLHVPWVHEDDPEDEDECVYRVRSRIEIGDWLYVRETFWNNGFNGTVGTHYKATCELEAPPWTWKPSIHMPKAFARIWLLVTGVRAEHESKDWFWDYAFRVLSTTGRPDAR